MARKQVLVIGSSLKWALVSSVWKWLCPVLQNVGSLLLRRGTAATVLVSVNRVGAKAEKAMHRRIPWNLVDSVGGVIVQLIP